MKNINLTSQEFETMLKSNKDAILLDVRTAEEFISARLPNSVLIDFYKEDFHSKIAELDKSKTYFIYCRSGSRSFQTCLFMLNEGFREVYNLSDGIIDWHGEIVRG
ncbi:MAG: rhodanese-like domain-containing protein [Ignavibacteriales bacterium]